MNGEGTRVVDALSGQVAAELLARSRLLEPDQIADALMDIASLLGVTKARIYLADLQQRYLRRCPAAHSAARAARRDGVGVPRARTFATDRVLVAATLEPAYEVGGDAYDYSLIGDRRVQLDTLRAPAAGSRRWASRNVTRTKTGVCPRH